MTDVWEGREERSSGLRPWTLVGIGMAIVLAEHIVVGGLLGGGGYLYGEATGDPEAVTVFFIWLFGIGLTQLGYTVPTFLIALVTRRKVAAGVALGTLVTFLLNGACFGVLCGAMGSF